MLRLYNTKNNQRKHNIYKAHNVILEKNMKNEKFQNLYRISSARANWHHYDGGMYFVTTCTRDMKHYFGEIFGGEMRLSEIGQYAKESIESIPTHNKYAEVPLFVVMPNHIHLVVIIDSFTAPVETEHAPSLQTADVCSRRRDGACSVSTYHIDAPSPQQKDRWLNDTVDEQMRAISLQKNKLSFVIGNMKSAVTRFANSKCIPFAWQPRFHDRIIRNTDELNGIAKYIENNVAKWEFDRYYQ